MVDRPRGWEPGERVADVERAKAQCELDPTAADMAGEDVVVGEVVVLRPGVQQADGAAWAQLALATLQQQLFRTVSRSRRATLCGRL